MIAQTSHRYGSDRIAEWLNTEREWSYPRPVPYHPRSDAHGRAQCQYFLDDLLHESAAIRHAGRNGDLVYQENYQVGHGGLSWNTDLVLGAPHDPQSITYDGSRAIGQADLADIYLAVDAKSIMTEHQKARRNRQRDINSFADIMHHHHEHALSAGIVLVNAARRFDSPLRPADEITHHANIVRIVDEVIDMFDALDRSAGEISPNLDGGGIVVVDHTNRVEDIGRTRRITGPPAPQPHHRARYENFVTQMAVWVETRFLA